MNEPLQRQDPNKEEVAKVLIQGISQLILLIFVYCLLKG